jgi:hypothetical protein
MFHRALLLPYCPLIKLNKIIADTPKIISFRPLQHVAQLKVLALLVIGAVLVWRPIAFPQGREHNE